MSTRKLGTGIAGLLALAVALFAADNPFFGTWKLNAAKSKLDDSGISPNATIRIEPDGDGMKVSVQTTDAKGQPLNFTYQATFDGKEGTASNSPTFDTISLKRVNDHTLTATGKKDGKVVFTDRRTVSADGKTMTLSRRGTNPEGKPFQATLVMDKQ